MHKASLADTIVVEQHRRRLAGYAHRHASHAQGMASQAEHVCGLCTCGPVHTGGDAESMASTCGAECHLVNWQPSTAVQVVRDAALDIVLTCSLLGSPQRGCFIRAVEPFPRAMPVTDRARLGDGQDGEARGAAEHRRGDAGLRLHLAHRPERPHNVGRLSTATRPLCSATLGQEIVCHAIGATELDVVMLQMLRAPQRNRCVVSATGLTCLPATYMQC